jgi:hypothetical protein
MPRAQWVLVLSVISKQKEIQFQDWQGEEGGFSIRRSQSTFSVYPTLDFM